MTRLSLGVAVTAAILSTGITTSLPGWADNITPASDGTGTQVTQSGNDHAITGGTTSADNQNLFHSFTEFNLLTGERATFIADPAIVNILSRVTGGNPSFLDGLLQTAGSEANLFFINPSGIVFGPNSALNLQGSFTAVTADQVNFATGTFSTVGTPNYSALVGHPESFTFSVATPGSVMNAGNLAVSPGESVVLVGGQTINTGTISASGGEIIISAVEGGKLVRIQQEGLLLNLEVETLANTSPLVPLPAFSPVSLPDLLTGNTITTASDITINPDGTIQLVSGLPIETASGNVTVVGTLDVSGAEGGQITISGNNLTLPEGLIDISGIVAGGNLAIYADSALSLGISVDATGSGNALFDPPTLTITEVEAATFVSALMGGGIVTLEASETININAPIDSSGQDSSSILELRDEDDDGNFVINLNAPITLGSSQTLTGDGSLVNLAATGSLQNAVDLAADGSTVNLAEGTFPAGTQVTLSRNIALNGFETGTTILNGNNTNRLLEVLSGVTVSLSNLTLMNGNTDGNGGGILNAGTLIISNSTISDNSAEYSGGGIYNSGTLIINNSILSNNLALDGGGIENGASSTTLTNTVLTENTAQRYGGGINSNGNTITVTNSDLTGNTADQGGGIFHSSDSIATVTSSTISGNVATLGGGISNGSYNYESGIVNLTDSTISTNTAQSGGGIYNSGNSSGAAFTLTNSTISGNTAQYSGGGIYNSNNGIGGILNLSNSTISGNTAQSGGGIHNSGTLTSSSSLISGNTASTGANFFNDVNVAAFISGGNNLFGNSGDAGVFAIALDVSDIVPIADLSQILDLTLADNGGSTLTLALVEGSPAIDAGSGSGPDQRGVAVVNSIRDIGAFEFSVSLSDDPEDPDTSDIPDDFDQEQLDCVSGCDDPETDLLEEDALEDDFLEDDFLDEGLEDDFEFEDDIVNDLLDEEPDETPSEEPQDNVFDEWVDNEVLNEESGDEETDSDFSNEEIANESATGGGDTEDLGDEVSNEEPTDDTSQENSDAEDFGDEVSNEELTDDNLDENTDKTDDESRDGNREADPGTTDLNNERFQADLEEISFNEWVLEDTVFADEFVEYFDLPSIPEPDFETSQATLRSLVETAGIPPALVYARFGAAGTETTAPQASLQQKQSVDPQPTDILELILVTPGGQPKRIVVPEATREKVIASVHQLQRELTDRTRRRQTAYLRHAQQLYSWLVVPLEAELKSNNIGHLSFIMAPGLRSLPLATLHDGEQFIIENYTVGLMPSLALTDTRYTDLRQAAVLAMGASEFRDQPDLPAVPLELSTIVGQIGRKGLNEAFTPQTLVSMRQDSGYPILHLATHGEFRAGGPSNSYIQFWNQRLGLDQLGQLQLNNPAVELLVMSACRTALGDERAELGFAGLAVQAGVKSALATLWQVSDLETAGLMAEFYSQLNQRTYKAEALRQAQLAMLKGEVMIEDGVLLWNGGSQPLPPDLASLDFGDTSHPYFWAAFTIVGSPW